jgi:hypothetical protein
LSVGGSVVWCTWHVRPRPASATMSWHVGIQTDAQALAQMGATDRKLPSRWHSVTRGTISPVNGSYLRVCFTGGEYAAGARRMSAGSGIGQRVLGSDTQLPAGVSGRKGPAGYRAPHRGLPQPHARTEPTRFGQPGAICRLYEGTALARLSPARPPHPTIARRLVPRRSWRRARGPRGLRSAAARAVPHAARPTPGSAAERIITGPTGPARRLIFARRGYRLSRPSCLTNTPPRLQSRRSTVSW